MTHVAPALRCAVLKLELTGAGEYYRDTRLLQVSEVYDVKIGTVMELCMYLMTGTAMRKVDKSMFIGQKASHGTSHSDKVPNDRVLLILPGTAKNSLATGTC